MKIMGKKGVVALALAAGTVAAAASSSFSAGIKYEDGDKYLKIGGRIQIQYHSQDPKGGETTDLLFFRRLRPYIEGSFHKNWKGKIQWDMGKATGDNEVAIKDAYFQYKGVDGIKITAGNAFVPFSRETLTSSKKQQLVERTFVGDHNYGSPDRMPGAYLDGVVMDKMIEYSLGFAEGAVDPDDDKLDFDTLANAGDDWNQGWIYAGRVSFHPLGHLKLSQGDFKRKMKATISAAAYSWSNDGDNNTHTTAGVDDGKGKPDVKNVTGMEVSGAFRGMGLSVDAQYNKFSASTEVDKFTGGIYKDGDSDLSNMAVEAGFMVIPSKLEIVGGYQTQNAENYAEAWNRISYGANWYVAKHDIKVQATYRNGENLKGKKDNDENEMFVQVQYVF